MDCNFTLRLHIDNRLPRAVERPVMTSVTNVHLFNLYLYRVVWLRKHAAVQHPNKQIQNEQIINKLQQAGRRWVLRKFLKLQRDVLCFSVVIHLFIEINCIITVFVDLGLNLNRQKCPSVAREPCVLGRWKQGFCLIVDTDPDWLFFVFLWFILEENSTVLWKIIGSLGNVLKWKNKTRHVRKLLSL